MGLPEFWFIAIAFLFTGYFVLEGFDFGVGMLMPFVGVERRGDATGVPGDGTAATERAAKGDTRRRTLLNTIGPVWDANEVWLLTAGGALFAAFGGWYATMFSAFYLPLLLILVGLITRVVAIEWRGKINNPRWRKWCDFGIGLGSWIPSIVWGVAFANILRGLPIDADHQYTGGLLNLFNPYGILGGLTMLLVFLTHGATYLMMKLKGDLYRDAQRYATRLSVPTAVVAAIFLLWTQIAYGKAWTWIPVIISAIAIVAVIEGVARGHEVRAFAANCVAIIGTMTTLFGSLYPTVLPSTLNPAWDLTIANTSSSHYTLMIMTWCSLLITPFVLAYQVWSYWVFRQRISVDNIPAPGGLPSLRLPSGSN